MSNPSRRAIADLAIPESATDFGHDANLRRFTDEASVAENWNVLEKPLAELPFIFMSEKLVL